MVRFVRHRDAERRAASPQPTDHSRAKVKHGLFGTCVAFFLFEGVCVGH
jgi:hypothetical protein